MEREEANWAGVLDGLQQGVLEGSHARLAADWAGVEQQHMQQKLDADCRRHACCTAAAAAGLQQPDMVVQPDKALPCTYMSHRGRHRVLINHWQCSSCGSTVAANPVAVGCMSNAPVVPSILWDMALLDGFVRAEMDGQSTTGGTGGFCCTCCVLFLSC